MADVSKQMEAFGVAMDVDTSPLMKGLSTVGRGIGQLVTNLKGAQIAVAAFAIGVAAATFVAARRAVAAAVTIDAAMREVATLTEQTAEQMGFLRKAVLELSTNVPAPPEILSKGLYQVISAGITDTADALNVLGIASRAAVGGLTDTFTAVDAITTVLNAFNLDATEAGRVADVLFETVRQGKLTFEDAASSIGNVATSAGVARLKFEDAAAAIATLTKFGLNARKATTALNSLLVSILNPTKKVKDAAAELGIEWNEAALRAKGLNGVLADLSRVADGNASVIAKLVPAIRSFRAAAVLAGQGGNEYTRILNKMNEAQGAATDAFLKIQGSLENQKILLKNHINKLWAELGEKILPAVIAAYEKLNDLFVDNRERLAQLLEQAGDLQGAFELRRDLFIDLLTESIKKNEKELRLAKQALDSFWTSLQAGESEATAFWNLFVPASRSVGRGLKDAAALADDLRVAMEAQPAILQKITGFVNRLTHGIRSGALTQEEQLELVEHFQKNVLPNINVALRETFLQSSNARDAWGDFLDFVNGVESALRGVVVEGQRLESLRALDFEGVQKDDRLTRPVFSLTEDLEKVRDARQRIVDALEEAGRLDSAAGRRAQIRLRIAELDLSIRKSVLAIRRGEVGAEQALAEFTKARQQAYAQLGDDVEFQIDQTRILNDLIKATGAAQSRTAILLEGELKLLELKNKENLIALTFSEDAEMAAIAMELIARRRLEIENEIAIALMNQAAGQRATLTSAEKFFEKFGSLLFGGPGGIFAFGKEQVSPTTEAIEDSVDAFGKWVKIVKQAQKEVREIRKEVEKTGGSWEVYRKRIEESNDPEDRKIANLIALAEKLDTVNEALLAQVQIYSQAARSTLQFAQAIGALGSNAARSLGALIELSSAIGQVVAAGGGLTPLSAFAIAAPALNLIGSLFGGGTSEADKAREKREQEAARVLQEQLDAIKANNERLRELTEKLDVLAGVIGDIPSDIAGPIKRELDRILAEEAEFINLVTSTTGPDFGGRNIAIQQKRFESLADFVDFLETAGLTGAEIREIGEALDLDLTQLALAADGLAYNSYIARQEMEQLAEAIKLIELEKLFEGVEGANRLAQLKIDFADEDDPVKKLDIVRGELAKFGADLSELGDLLGDDLVKALEDLFGADITTPEGRTLLENAIQALFTALTTGALDDVLDALGGFTPEQFLEFLSMVESGLDEIAAAEAEDGVDQSFQIFRGITEITGNRIVGTLETISFWDRETAINTALIVEALTGDNPLDIPTTVTGDDFGGVYASQPPPLYAPNWEELAAFVAAAGGVVIDEINFNITVEGDDKSLVEIGQEIGRVAADEFDRELGDRTSKRERTFGKRPKRIA